MRRSWTRTSSGVKAAGDGENRGQTSQENRLEIRLVGTRYHGELSAGLEWIFGAYQVRPGAHGGPIRDGRGPGHRENVFVLDREMQLQHLTPVVGVEFPA